MFKVSIRDDDSNIMFIDKQTIYIIDLDCHFMKDNSLINKYSIGRASNICIIDNSIALKIGKIQYDNFVDKNILIKHKYFQNLFNMNPEMKCLDFSLFDLNFITAMCFVKYLCGIDISRETRLIKFYDI